MVPRHHSGGRARRGPRALAAHASDSGFAGRPARSYRGNLTGHQIRVDPAPPTTTRGAGCGRAGQVITEAEAVAELSSGMTVGIGGWGSRRKPMSVVREILRSDLTDLTVVAYGGPDVGLLCRAGKVAKVISGFVSLDSIPLEPNYRIARQNGTIEAAEWDEGMLLLGLQAAAWRVPFLPTRAGLGSDIPAVMPDLQTVRSPYPEPASGEHEELLAVPALQLDAAFVHQNRADRSGNALWLGEDPVHGRPVRAGGRAGLRQLRAGGRHRGPGRTWPTSRTCASPGWTSPG